MARKGRAGLSTEDLQALHDSAVKAFSKAGESAGEMFRRIIAEQQLDRQTVGKYMVKMGLYKDGKWQWDRLRRAKPGQKFKLSEESVARPRKTATTDSSSKPRTVVVVALELEKVRAEIARLESLREKETALKNELQALL